MPNQKLKILFLVPRFPTVSETFILNQIVDLIDRGHQVHIFATEKTNKKIHSKILEYDLLDKTYYSEYPSKFSTRITKFLSVLSKAKLKYSLKLLKTINFLKYGIDAFKLTQFFKLSWVLETTNDYDIVHAHFGPMSDYYYDAKHCGFFSNSKLITTFHGYDIIPSESEINKQKYKNLIENNTPLTVNTLFTATLLENIGVKKENIHIIPVGLDTSYYSCSAKQKADNPIIILFCGRIIKFKGVSRIADIAKTILNNFNHKNIKFKIIGESGESDNHELNALKQKIKSYKLENYIELLGAQTQNEVIKHMSEAAIYIMPGITTDDGRAENQGLVIQEAQALKTPVIVTNAGGMKYGLIDNETGYVVDENDLNTFCEKINYLIKYPNFRKKMGENGRDFVTNNYDSKLLGEQLVSLYYSTIK